ncbi:phosphoglycerate mutase family protein [Lactobacillaceae bacterium 24-114]
MTKVNIYLVRHGQTYYNIYNKLQGWSNSPLTKKGKKDAQTAGDRLKDIHFDAAFCSDTTRAMETCQTILDENSKNSVNQPVVSSYFREQFYGSYEGINMDAAWYNAGAPHGCKNFKDIVTKYSIGQAKDWLKEADPFRDAENNEEYWERMEKALKLIRSADLADGANVLWVSHGNTLLSLVEKYGEGKYDVTVRPNNGSLTLATLTDDSLIINEYNK